MCTENKLCRRGQYYKAKCPDHPGRCTQTLEKSKPIGDEERRSMKVASDILESMDNKLLINRLTTDSDSHCVRGVQKIMKKAGVTVEHQKDPGHLARAQRRKIIKTNFTQQVFPGRTRAAQNSFQRRFAIDLSKRCAAEHKHAAQKLKGNSTKLQDALKHTPSAIMDCYSGNCGESCQKHSFVCKGTPQNHWRREFIPGGALINVDNSSDKIKMKELISLRLGDAILEQTKYNTTTQKTEAVHKGYRKSDPKGITFSTNFHNRTMSAVSRLNDGVGKSTLRKLETVGAPVTPGSRAAKTLKTLDDKVRYDAKRQKSYKFRSRRRAIKLENFKAYDVYKSASTVYKKGLIDEKVCADHAYSKS